jgi:hypothetical protein
MGCGNIITQDSRSDVELWLEPEDDKGNLIDPRDKDFHLTFGVQGLIEPAIVCSKTGDVFENCYIGEPDVDNPFGAIVCTLDAPEGGWPEGLLTLDNKDVVGDPNYEDGKFITFDFVNLGVRFVHNRPQS